MKKCLAALTASVMALGSLPALAVQAEEVALPGDVDGDGYITGHDSALLCRSLREDNFSLTEEELARADATGDGLVDRNDLDWIRENEEYPIGDVDLNGSMDLFDSYQMLLSMYPEENVYLNTLEQNLADFTADREVHPEDVYALFILYSASTIDVVDKLSENYVENGTYYSIDFKAGDFDGDGLITHHDVALIQCSAVINEYVEWVRSNDSFAWMDSNRDGFIDDKDISDIKTMVEYDEPYGHCDGKSSSGAFQSSYDALMLSSYQNTEMLEIINQSDADAMKPDGQVYFWDESRQRYVIGLTDYKLYDVTLDGVVDIEDASSLLSASSRLAIGKSFFLEDGYYEYKLFSGEEFCLDIMDFPN